MLMAVAAIEAAFPPEAQPEALAQTQQTAPAHGGLPETPDGAVELASTPEAGSGPRQTHSPAQTQTPAAVEALQHADETMARMLQEMFEMQAEQARLLEQADAAHARCLSLEDHKEVADEQKAQAEGELKDARAELAEANKRLRVAQEMLDRSGSASASAAGRVQEQQEPAEPDAEVPDGPDVYVMPRAVCAICQDEPAQIGCDGCQMGGVCVSCFVEALKGGGNLVLLSPESLRCPACFRGSVHPQIPLACMSEAGQQYNQAVQSYKKLYSMEVRRLDVEAQRIKGARRRAELEIEENLVRRTPCCKMAFDIDTTSHCCACYCDNCSIDAVIDGVTTRRPTEFCFFCYTVCPPPKIKAEVDPAHRHVAKCHLNPYPDHVYVDKPGQYERVQREFVLRVVDDVLNRYRPVLELPPHEFEELRRELTKRHLGD